MSGFITGLPRSRTKWFADYFDGIPGVTAYHEPLNGLRSKREFYDIVDRGGIIVDSGLLITDFQERYNLPTVIIERDIDAVFDSLCRYFEAQGLPLPNRLSLDLIKEGVDALQGLRIAFEDIDARMAEIHRHLGVPFDAEYAARMAGDNRQVEQLQVNTDSWLLWAE